MEISKKSLFLYIIIGILILMNVGSIATLWAWRFGEHSKPPIENMQSMDKNAPHQKGRLLFEKELNFSKQQLAEADKLRESHFSEMIRIGEEIRNCKDEITTLLSKPDSLKLKDLINKIGEKQKEGEYNNYDHFLKLRNLCDDKQKIKFDELLKEIFRPMHPEMMQGRMPNRPESDEPPPPLK
jgi:hypothetical protein